MSARNACLALGSILCSAIPGPAHQVLAEVATDGTVGPRLELSGPNYDIGAGLGSRAGDNLFHSFERFDLRTLDDGTIEAATFSGPPDIKNVISRVTGNDRSDINGTLQSTIPGADFFLINPAGVVFGPNASLDVQGSFHVSTADELRFADGAVFSATNPDASSLTIATPEAFGFLGSTPAAITLNGSIVVVDQGEALSVVGGDLALRDGAIAAPAGVINLVSVASPTEVRTTDGALESIDGGEIVIARSGLISRGDGGGTIRIRGGDLIVEDWSLIDASNLGAQPGRGAVDVRLVGDLTLSQSLIGAGSSGSGSGGTVDIAAANITLSEGLLNSNSLLGAGNAGSVTVTADRLSLLEGSQISSSTGQGSTGAGGEVQVTARESLLIAGRNARDAPSGIFASTEGAANSDRAAGNVTVTAGDLEIRDGLITSTTLTAGDAGSVTVTADRLTLLEGGQISSSPLFESTGAGGEVQVTARDSLLIAGRNAPRDAPSGIFASTEGAANSDRAAGNVTVTAGDLKIRDGGQISSATETAGDAGAVTVTVTAGDLEIRDGLITSTTLTAGDAGSVTVTADRLTLLEGGIFASAEGAANGAAGNVTVTAGTLELRDGLISSVSEGAGDAGSVTVTADRLSLLEGSQIISSPLSESTGAGGQVQVTARDSLFIAGHNARDNASGIFATAEGAANSDRAAGNVTVMADDIEIRDGGLITSSTLTAGDAGSVTVTADDIEIRDGGVISSTAFGGGEAGKVTVEAGRLVLDRGEIITGSASAGGGEIQLLVSEVIDLHDSVIITTVAGGNDPTAGNIRIDPTVLIIDGSIINADAFAGSGGNVRIIADNILVPEGDLEGLLARDDISASGATEEVDGTVAISAPEVDLAGSLVVLEVPLLDAASLLRERCAARRDIGASSFTGIGRGGLPPSPDQPLMSDYTTGAAGRGQAARWGTVEAEIAPVGAPTGQDGVLLLQPCAGAL